MRWGYLLTFWVGNSQKNFSASEKFFLVVLSHWQCFFEVWKRKNFSACEKFFLTHSDILLWPHSIWLRIRVAQCPMACDGAVTKGWPWESSHLILPSAHPPAHDRSPPACAHECAALCPIAQLHAAGNGNIPYAKPVAGRMPSILQSILIQNGAKGGIRGLKASPRRS